MHIRRIICVILIFVCVSCVSGDTQAQTVPFDLRGWGWLGNGNMGFLSLSCANSGLSGCTGGTNYQVTIQADNKVTGYAWMGLADGGSALGWLNFAPGATAPDGSTGGVYYNPITKALSGWGRISALAPYGAQEGWVKFWDNTSGKWGVQVDADGSGNYFLRGLAWANGGDLGLGFINFGLETWGGKTYLQTLGGEVYSAGNINAANASATPNASYLISSDGTITNFSSAEGADWEVENANLNLGYPELANNYRNALGKIDIPGLITVADGMGHDRYGYLVDAASIPSAWSGNFSLSGKVYYLDGDLTVNGDLIFENGLTGIDGSGTIIVNGNLYLDANVFYAAATSLSEIYNLASVAWIIQGDLIINPRVRNVVGNFFVLGEKGEMHTGTGIYPLEISGLVAAREFYFERTHSGAAAGVTPEPAEQVVYDGRILANTPPGLIDFAEGLPVFQQVRP